MKIKTISVIERVQAGHLVTHAFPDTPVGNVEAQTLFRQITREQEADGGNGSLFTVKEIDQAINEGYINDSHNGGNWELYLVHSEA